MAGLNKKILCFVDEYGTAGDPNFSLGCIVVWARECGKVDKAFSDLLPANINEVHAVNLSITTLQGLLGKFHQTLTPASLVMLNMKCQRSGSNKAEMYATALIETVKVALKHFRKSQPKSSNKLQQGVGNVELILDANSQNTHPDFESMITKEREAGGMFSAVTRVVAIDSAASRTLQLADIAAHSRAWIINGEANANGLHTGYGIRIQ